MTNTMTDNRIQLFTVDTQAAGAFDEGRITETKPIGFPGEAGAVDRVGPLFYWAWAAAEKEGTIALHPHKAFEIVSYVVSGKLGHYDTLGNRRAIGSGGIQVMQTGSGVSHEEAMLEPNTQFLQIWFEPNLREAALRAPTYADYEASDLDSHKKDGVEFTPLLGEGAPVKLVADARARIVTVPSGTSYARSVDADRSLATLVLSGTGVLDDERTARERDFLLLRKGGETPFQIRAGGEAPLQLLEIDVPVTVDYPLYRK